MEGNAARANECSKSTWSAHTCSCKAFMTCVLMFSSFYMTHGFKDGVFDPPVPWSKVVDAEGNPMMLDSHFGDIYNYGGPLQCV